MIKKYLSTILGFILPALVATLPLLAFAREQPTQRFLGIIKRLTNFATWLLLALAVMFVIYAAYLYLTSQGDPEKVKHASKVILYAAISIGVALLAYVFVSIIEGIILGPPGAALPPGGITPLPPVPPGGIAPNPFK